MELVRILFFTGALVYTGSAINFGPFNNVSGGVWDAWNHEDPDNVRGGTFSAKFGGGKLWLISNRIYRQGPGHPWDPALRGGIVSTLSVDDATWTHKTYGQVTDDLRGEKLFIMRGRLFVLTYSDDENKITFRKLYTWDDPEGRWKGVPLDIDPLSTTLSSNELSALTLVVPKADTHVAYACASSHSHARRFSELSFSNLEVHFDANAFPRSAKLEFMVRHRSDSPSAVTIMFMKNEKLYALVENFLSEGYVSDYDNAYEIDLRARTLDNVTLTGSVPVVHARTGENAFQTLDHLIIVGGVQTYGVGQIRYLRDIWALNMNTFQWERTGTQAPEKVQAKATLDKLNKKLYVVSLTDGVQAAQIFE